MTPTPDTPAPDAWQRALTGDRDAFEKAVSPYLDRLMAASRRLLDVRRDRDWEDDLERAGGAAGGTAPSETDLTPEELVGETLVQAYERRDRFDPDQMGFGAWLLGLQTRSLTRFARQESLYAQRKAISLDEAVPTGEDEDAVEEALYEFRQPFTVTTYEDLIAGSAPGDPDLSLDRLDAERLTEAEREALADADLGPTRSHAILLHDEFELSLPEVAQILDASLKDTAEHLNLARATLRQRIGSIADFSGEDPTLDSYTGDPLPDA